MSTSAAPTPAKDLRFSETESMGAPAVLRAALAELLEVVRLPMTPGDAGGLARFDQARHQVVGALRAWPKREKKHPVWAEVRQMVVQVVRSGWLDGSLAEAGALTLEPLKAWGELAALMLLTPAWRQAHTLTLADIPDDWWSAYISWVFAAPRGFEVPGDAEAYARHHERCVVELARWAERSPGSAAVRGAMDAYVAVAEPVLLALSRHNLVAAATARANILGRLFGGKPGDYTPFPLPRSGRRLRVGVIAEAFDSTQATYELMPCFEQLDPERFEAVLYYINEAGGPTEAHCRRRASRHERLAVELDARLAQLRAAELDVAVFAGELATRLDDVTRLALHRVAPLQVATSHAGGTTGLPEIDLFLSGALSEAAGSASHYRERLLLLPGTAQAFNQDTDRPSATREWTRPALGIPEHATVFVSAAHHRLITPETWAAWSGILDAVPDSWLLIQPFTDGKASQAESARLATQCAATLNRHEIDSERVIISTLDLDNRADVRRLLSMGNIYLDTLPSGDATGVLHALACGMPVVALEGTTLRSRAGSGLLQALKLRALVATDESGYAELAASLAENEVKRTELADRVTAALERLPIFTDSLGVSDAFGELLETAFDEVVDAGLPAFKASREPIQTTSAVALDGASRRARGLELMQAGRHARATEYLIAALSQDEGTASLWFDVARALRANGQPKDAIQALEAALRLDETLLDGWRMLVELADEAGLRDLSADARQIISGLTTPAASAGKGIRLNLGGKLGHMRPTGTAS